MIKKAILKPVEWAGDLTRKLHIALMLKAAECMESPRQCQIMLASAAVTFTGLFLSTDAHADGRGIAGMVDTAAQQGDSIKTNLGKLFSAGGFGAAGYGGYNWWRKGKEGENSHIKGGQIFTPILAGAALGATGFILVKAGETVGIQASSQGQLPR